jgi:hypothetical protein
MYGEHYFTEDSPAHHTLVLGEVQTMDCRMHLLPTIIYPILCFTYFIWVGQVLFLDDSIVTMNGCAGLV